MGIEKQEVKTIKYQYKCNACNRGYMILNKKRKLRETPPSFPHNCNNALCKRTQFLDRAYPYINFEPIIIQLR